MLWSLLSSSYFHQLLISSQSFQSWAISQGTSTLTHLFFSQLCFFYRVWILIQMEHMAHNTPLALGQILPRTPGLITHLDILRPITPQRFQALTVHLATARPQSLVGCIPSRTARLKHLLLGHKFQDILHHRWAFFCWVCIFQYSMSNVMFISLFTLKGTIIC